MRSGIIVLLCFSTLMAKGQALTSIIADSLFATGHYAKAINFYARNKSRQANLQIARAYKAMGHRGKAIVQYQSIVIETPDVQIANFELGKLLIKTKDYEGAKTCFSQLISLDDDNPEYHYYLGEIFRELEQGDSSVVAYKHAVKRDSTHLRSLFQLGKYFVIRQEKNSALRYIEKGLDVYPEDVSLINLKALVLFNNGAYEQAIPWFEKVLALGETKKYVYEKLAYSHYKNWDFEKARENYKIVLDYDTSNSETYFNLAEAYRKDKHLDSAEIFIKKGMDVQRPILAKGYGSLAGLARERGDLQSALEYYQLAHKETPDDARGYYHICTVADQVYDDPKIKLAYYKRFMEMYGSQSPYLSKFVTKRIRKLKEEIPGATD